ncbi:MAG: mucoidy inhibitor MuiA family protein [Phycisphaerales bacterium]|nr:mucoidy inhibitor MuiA family protein [Phycisphaerales bacterium]
MKRTAIAAIFLSLAVCSVAAAAEETIVKGKVDAVTVYRGQALITRIVDLPGGEGLGEIVVSELPDRIVPQSLFAEGSDSVEIRSVVYRNRPVAQDVREEVRKIDDAVQQLNDQIAANTQQQNLLKEQRGYLDKLANFTAPTANVEMTKGVLNADQLKNLTSYQFEQRQKIADQEFKLTLEQRKLNEQANLLERQRTEITGRSSHVLREAVVFVSRKSGGGGGTLKLRYLVDNAGWAPSYNIRADAARKNATIEYQASIQQMSGEDWTNVNMTLSTATPNLVAAAPVLNPLTLTLSRTELEKAKEISSKLDYQTAQSNRVALQNIAEAARNTRGNWDNTNGPVAVGSGGGGGSLFSSGLSQTQIGNKFNVNNYENDLGLNKVADQFQVLELLAGDDSKSKPATRPSFRPATEGIVVTYQMKSRTSLPSRSDQQLIQIDSFGVKSDFYKVATPVLTTYVYDQATLTNTSNLVLLAGPVSTYVGGQFVGSGDTPTVAVGQPFTVGFGIDSSLRAYRERTDKTEITQGGNKIVSYTFRIAIDNFGTTPANVRIMDRLPTAKDSEVKVTFIDAETIPLSTDPEYRQSEHKKGILRWDITVPAQKRGTEAFSLTYKMNMEYDKNLAISAASVLREDEIRDLMSPAAKPK